MHSFDAEEGGIMKYGYDELTQAVRLNDAVLGAGRDIPEIAEGFGVDMDALTHVATQRALMSSEVMKISGAMPGGMLMQAAVGAGWVDGFFAALHMLEQANLTKGN
jgi:hypothetical protein